MVRDIDRLTSRTFDLLVVGGGIYGLTIAYDAAQRGLDVALIERGDFGSGASFNHSRTIHGGLRYLQTLDLARARESLRERRTLARIAPQAVRPLRFVLPLARSMTRGKIAMRAGFALDRLVAFDRNRGVPPALKLPAGRVMSSAEAVRRFPSLRRQPLTGAAVWYDYITPESDRLTFAYAIAAARHGAALANYVEATAPVLDGTYVSGVEALDCQTGRTLTIRARLTVNATGSAVNRLTRSLRNPQRVPMLKAMNLVTRLPAGDEAVAGRSSWGRNLFAIPWRDRALFGTWESRRPCDADNADVTEGEVAEFIDELNQAFPSLGLTLADVTLIHRGVVPASVRANGTCVLEAHERIIDAEGMITVAGTKYTTARAVAERVTDRVMETLQRPRVACRTATTSLIEDDDQARTTDVDPHLVAAYGGRYRAVLDVARGKSEWCQPISRDSPVVGAELVWAAREEMAVTLVDAAVRRTPLGALGFPGESAARRAADIVGGELGWSEEHKRQEIANLRKFYAPI